MNRNPLERLWQKLWRVNTVAALFFGGIAVAVVYVVGTIAFQAYQNKGLIPPPETLDRYDCNAPVGAFSIFYLHGTDRVQIKSASGLLEGTVHQNRFDWPQFGGDRSVLGFTPPVELSFEDGQGMRVRGVDLADVSCKRQGDGRAHQRVLTPQ